MAVSTDISATEGIRFARLLTGVVVGAGLFSALLGLTVLLGWHTRSATLIQILPTFVPMQYNTAIGFTLCGTALLLGIRGDPRCAALAGTMAAVVGILTLGQYVFSVNLGIDELLQEHYITIETSHPGRMAPNTAICFALIGVASVFSIAAKGERYRSLVSILLSSFAFGLGAVALSGYLTHVEATYGWGRLTRMAVHTAIGFIALSTGIVCLICAGTSRATRSFRNGCRFRWPSACSLPPSVSGRR